MNTVSFCSQELDRLNLAIATEQDKKTPRRRRLSAWGVALPVRRCCFSIMEGVPIALGEGRGDWLRSLLFLSDYFSMSTEPCKSMVYFCYPYGFCRDYVALF